MTKAGTLPRPAPELEDVLGRKRLPEGISARHARGCTAAGGRCNCEPTYQAQVYSPRERKRISKSFPRLDEAKAWRHDALVALRVGTLQPARRSLTLRQAADEWQLGAAAGVVRNRSGHPYKPSALRGYEQALRLRILPELGGAKLSEIRRADIQRFVNRMLGEGLDPSTIRNTLLPLRAIYRQAVSMDEVAVNPTTGLTLPAQGGRRERFASPGEAAQLLDALPASDRALWATAMYAGLRLGELQALRWEDVDLAGGVIRVRRGYDAVEGRGDPADGMIETKSRAGRRSVPIPAVLRDELVEHRMWDRPRAGLVFGRTADQPFSNSTVYERSRRWWKKADLQPIGLHECRHTFASLMIAAGVNAKALSTFMGHSSITVTLDRYGHLMPGSETEAAGLLDAYLERANTQARLAAIEASE